MPSRDGSHLGSLAAIPVTTTAEDADQLPRGKGPGRRQRIGKAIGGVGIVHQHRRQSIRRRTPQHHPLHPPRHTAETPDGIQQPLQGEPLLQQNTNRLQQVHQVEATQQWGMDQP